MSTPLVTFVIPTIGRETLSRSIQSLHNLTNPNWHAIVVFDKIEPTIQSTDKVTVLKYSGTSQGCGGAQRNLGIESATTELVAFLDDDDTITPDYVDALIAEAKDNDIVIFHMLYSTGCLLPSDKAIFWGNVGISFSIKRSIFPNIKFREEGRSVDFYLLESARVAGLKIVISDKITYLVRPEKKEKM
jgi:glycosyltransferase involved in cell wall biosynthesis